MADPSNNAAPGRKFIVAPTVGQYGPSTGKVAVVWGASAFIYGAIVGGAYLLFTSFGLVGATEVEPEVETPTEMVSESKEYDLTNLDKGDDDSVPLAYNLDRIENVSVPGQVDPTAAVGIVNAPETAPMSVPPPAGFGGGTGAAMADPAADGIGASIGTLGGMGSKFAPGGFAGRSGATKVKMLQEGGGNAASEAAVAAGLQFLALHQAPDGHWGLNDFNRYARDLPLPAGKIAPDNSQPMTTRKNDTAGTAFGLLPFLAAGITNKPSVKGKQTDYSKGVERAIVNLMARQSKASADRGNYGGDMYSHGIATIAMCEAYGLTSDPRIKNSAQMGINYILSAQDPAGGGWRYAVRTPGDTSVTGWQVMALKSGQMSGLSVPRNALKKVEKYLDACETSNKGGYGYMPSTGESRAMTAVGGLCRQYLGVNPRNPSLLGTVKRIKQTPPGSGDVYYEYYATQVMHHMGGEAWAFWNLGPDGTGKTGIRDTLIARQDKGSAGRPGQRGSFDGSDHVGGRLGATSLCLLSLEVYYRHLPLYRRDMGVMKPEK